MYIVHIEGINPFTHEMFKSEKTYYDYFDACHVAEIEARNGLFQNDGTARVTVLEYKDGKATYIRHYAIEDDAVWFRDGTQNNLVYSV